MNTPKDIFRAYDIRGIYPEELNEDVAENIGKAFGTLLNTRGLKSVVVGLDDRSSSGTLANSLMNGLISTGIKVFNTGITVEPAMHYFTFLDDIDASVNITASHNPEKFNGVKIDLKRAVPFHGEDLINLYNLIEKGDFLQGQGSYEEVNLNEKYIDFISSKFKLKNKLKVVVYCGNGATSEIYPKVLEKIGAEVDPLRCYLDPGFPVGVPDPESERFYPELRDQVLSSKAVVGVGFDGDGDRVGEVDEKGVHYKADEIFLLYIKDVLSKKPGSAIAFDVKCSQIVEQYIKKLGGIPRMLKTGRSVFLEEVFADRAILAGELSGHTYFKDDYLGYDDGIYAACRLLKIMDETGLPLSKLMQQFPKMVSTPELKYTVDEGKKFKLVQKITDNVKADKKYIDVNTLDGVKAHISSTGWFLVRSSNTSPYLSIRVEGIDKSEVDKILKDVANIIKTAENSV